MTFLPLFTISINIFFSLRYRATALSSLLQSEKNKISWSVGVAGFTTAANTVALSLTSGSFSS